MASAEPIPNRAAYALAQALWVARPQIPEGLEPVWADLAARVAAEPDTVRRADLLRRALADEMGLDAQARTALFRQLEANAAGPRPEADAPYRMPRTALPELIAKTFPPARWAIPGLIPHGLTLFAGKPKSGKSLLMFQSGIGIAAGTGVLAGSRACERGSVYYFDLENGEELLRDRAVQALEGAPAPDAFFYATEAARLGEGLVEALDVWMDEEPATRLIVIDTLEAVRPTGQVQENAYRADYAALRPLADWAKARRVAVVVVHHTSKRIAADVFDTISGSLGLNGSVDNLMVLAENDGASVLIAQGRRVPRIEVALKMDPASAQWQPNGTPEEARQSSLRRIVMRILREAEEALSPLEVAQMSTKTIAAPSVRVAMRRMARDGVLMQEERGKYRLPAFGEAPGEPWAADRIEGGADARGDDDADDF